MRSSDRGRSETLESVPASRAEDWFEREERPGPALVSNATLKAVARRILLEYPEGYVARKRAAGCDHLDGSTGRARGYGSGDFGT